MKKILLITSVFLLAASLVAACGGGQPPVATPTPTSFPTLFVITATPSPTSTPTQVPSPTSTPQRTEVHAYKYEPITLHHKMDNMTVVISMESYEYDGIFPTYHDQVATVKSTNSPDGVTISSSKYNTDYIEQNFPGLYGYFYDDHITIFYDFTWELTQ